MDLVSSLGPVSFTDSRRVIGTADTLSVEERVLRERETVTTMCPRVPSSRTLRSFMIVLEHPWTSRNVFPLSHGLFPSPVV